ncbi:MAG: prolyl oligopeptidase family serine peptidase [Gammaproteobacteria bacterium]|nr:prolyl oligopeptidase family serine peptidase [Gammaproteobacteria bacterium]MBU1557109.1 prolyl oligopeptidase family serine peptidase [Gammaproteobacteria bacterium]MBU2069938.1 prolyl oligopeptidase family serine peptidase [Gammaproteobacteria bacterium]MBU2185083.1 prolyl oligopeptidase family serine peptidase [Gammaproteobacteria bacterium]MBU2206951.1 prolyl oligopeptidase family serine peptidase [Gammaproteobacteria bacterium]
MKPVWLLLGTLLIANPVAAKQSPDLLPAFSTAQTLKSNFSCYISHFASYDSWLTMLSKKPKFNTTAFAERFPKAVIEQRQQQIDCRIFVYESDGVLVEGVMLQPRSTGPGKLPVVIYNRGGNAKGGIWNYGAIHAYLMPLAEQNYIVIASQYRGASAFPTGIKARPLADQFGGIDVNDVKNLLPIVEGMANADNQRLAMKGFSRGGMMSYLAARDMPQLKALIVEAGVADLEKQLVQRPEMENIYTKAMPNYAAEKTAQLSARSVLHWLDKLPPQLPILLVHGDKDVRVDIEQSQWLAKALSEKGHPHKLVIFPGADHGLDPNRVEADAETAAWLKLYL